MAILGYSSIGPDGYTWPPIGFAVMDKYTAPYPGTLNSMTFYCRRTASFSHTMQPVVCDASYNIIALGSTIDPGSSTPSWKTSNFAGQTFSAGVLWFGWTNTLRISAVNCMNLGSGNRNEATFPWGTDPLVFSAYGDLKFSMYITYTPYIAPGPVPVMPSYGNGSVLNPFVIMNLDNLNYMRTEPAAHYILGQDIDASATSGWRSGFGWENIANFTGSLDGRGFKITGLVSNG